MDASLKELTKLEQLAAANAGASASKGKGKANAKGYEGWTDCPGSK